MRNHTGRLVLAPRDPDAAPERVPLVDALTDVGFLGEPLAPEAGTYAVGEAFLRLVAFTGCAVRVEVAPGTEPDRPFCHVRIAGPFAEPVLLTGRNTRPPRCPACRAPLRAWRDRLPHPSAGAAPAQPPPCPTCGALSPPCRWDWKDSGSCARLWLEVEEVFPGEAAPTDSLAQFLETVTRTPWRHFYLQD
jgi:hypothetical protein